MIDCSSSIAAKAMKRIEFDDRQTMLHLIFPEGDRLKTVSKLPNSHYMLVAPCVSPLLHAQIYPHSPVLPRFMYGAIGAEMDASLKGKWINTVACQHQAIRSNPIPSSRRFV